MKNLYLLFLLCSTNLLAQFNFGIKAGLNYDSLGELKQQELSLTGIEAEAKTGFHVGVYTQLDLLLFSLRPELQYSQSKSQFGDRGSLNLHKIELPLLLGYDVFPFVDVFAGPSFQYIIGKSASSLTLGDLQEETTVGLHIGTRIKVGPVGVGLRFERGFTNNEISIINQNGVNIEGNVDARPKQWIVSLSYDLTGGRNRNNEN